ncbi:MAG: metal-sulfur cluster assembly factor [Bacteroidia bacterium]|nr:metal-sulfur cluster assembly factor [Bacteroidia bacterium]
MELFSEANKIEIDIYHSLKDVIDPELGINIIDLGLVYDIHYSFEKGIVINLTLSSEGCPMGDVILDDIKAVLKEKFTFCDSQVNLIWEPKWHSGFITPAGKKALNLN